VTAMIGTEAGAGSAFNATRHLVAVESRKLDIHEDEIGLAACDHIQSEARDFEALGAADAAWNRKFERPLRAQLPTLKETRNLKSFKIMVDQPGPNWALDFDNPHAPQSPEFDRAALSGGRASFQAMSRFSGMI
jgi:hypothetical protein